MTNAETLRQIMQDHGLTRVDTAKLLGVSLKTIEGWLATPGCSSHRKVKSNMIELLRLKVE